MKNLENNFSYDKLSITVFPFIGNEACVPRYILVIKRLYFNYLFLKETSISYNAEAKPDSAGRLSVIDNRGSLSRVLAH